MEICKICEKEIDNFTTCDSCGAIYCVEHLGDFNECGVCGKEHTKEWS